MCKKSICTIFFLLAGMLCCMQQSIYAEKESSMGVSIKSAVVLYVSHPLTVNNAVLFIKSIRQFGGSMKDTPVYVMNDAMAKSDVSSLTVLPGVTVHDIEIAPEYRSFPYSKKVHACASAEKILDGKVETLIYFDTEMLAFSSFDKMLLQKGASVSMRPVMLLNTVGLAPAVPVDAFWKALYNDAGVDDSKIPTIQAYIDEKKIRFYINCETISIRPELGIFREWQRLFIKRLSDETFMKTNCADQLHKIFLHQAVLSAVIAAKIPEQQIQWIPDKYVYSAHLHDKTPLNKKIERLNQAPLAGYDLQYAANPALVSLVPIDEPYRSWIISTYCDFLQVAPGLFREEGDCNTVVVVTKKGFILIDPSSTGYATSWLALKFGNKHPEAVLFTHAHQDHWNGLKYWKITDSTPMIIQRDWTKTAEYPERFEQFYIRRNIAFTGGQWMPQKDLVRIKPTITYIDELTTKIAGTSITMYHTPAETIDTSIIWLPEFKTALIGDSLSGSFPMLGTPRGSTPRFADDYISALNKLLSLNPDTVITGHGKPIKGNDLIGKTVSTYRDALVYVNETVIKGINDGKDVYTLINEITLPEQLSYPESFGKVSWAVRALYVSYTGWYDENPLSLLQSPESCVYDDIVELCSVDKLVERANTLLEKGDHQGALYITEIVLKNQPANKPMLNVRKKALQLFLERSSNWGESNIIKQEIQKTDTLLQ